MIGTDGVLPRVTMEKPCKPPAIGKAHCNTCGHHTKHLILVSRQHNGQQEDGYGDVIIQWCVTWELLECLGCETVALRKTTTSSEDWGESDVEYFPPAISRELPVWFSKLPGNLRELMKELYAALHADSTRLVVMGARALLDMVIVEKVGDSGTFKDKLKELETQGFVSHRNREYLDAALDAGHAAAHRGYAAKPEEVSHVMDIVENLLQAVYSLPTATAVLKASTPPRPPKPKSGSAIASKSPKTP